MLLSVTPEILLPPVWPNPLSLATTRGISVDIFSCPYTASGFLYTARQPLDAGTILAARCAAWASICRGGYELETDGRAQGLQLPLMRGEIRELLPRFPQLNLALFRLIRYTKIVVLHSF